MEIPNMLVNLFFMRAVLLLGWLLTAACISAQTVETQFGPIQGVQNGNVYAFLGIPFARPPIGDLRWKAPQNPDAWTDVLQTTDYAPACAQKAFDQADTTFSYIGEEDCLYLNVWTPQTGPGNRPVMVFIHGGGNQQGSASEFKGGTYLYDGKNLSSRGDVVVVTIQYRLGPFGFLVHPGLEAENALGKSGNYAVMDQILALQWVKNNIAKFGGDPDKTMIFGESAGGVNVGNLLLTPLSAGLFQRACIESAGPVIDDYNSSRNKGIAFADTFAPPGSNAEKIAFLRAQPAFSLLKYESSPLSGGVVETNWRPVVDHYVFQDFPFPAFKSGNFNKVPLMIGSNSEESGLSAPATVTPLMVKTLINTYVPAVYRPTALALYPPGNDNTEARKSFVGILTDGQFTTIARRTAQCVSANQQEPVWRYFFTHKHTIPALASFGSYHGMELFYVFNNWENATLGSGPLFKPADDSVQNVMRNYWVRFARNGNPNDPNLTPWPQYKANTDCYMEIKATPDGSQCGLRTAQTDFWDTVTGFVACTNTSGTETAEDAPLKIFPNPSNGFLQLPEGKQYRIFDTSGVLMQEGKPDPEGIWVGKLPAGIYFIWVDGRISKISVFY